MGFAVRIVSKTRCLLLCISQPLPITPHIVQTAAFSDCSVVSDFLETLMMSLVFLFASPRYFRLIPGRFSQEPNGTCSNRCFRYSGWSDVDRRIRYASSFPRKIDSLGTMHVQKKRAIRTIFCTLRLTRCQPRPLDEKTSEMQKCRVKMALSP
mgnify:CR=1 FL=1